MDSVLVHICYIRMQCQLDKKAEDDDDDGDDNNTNAHFSIA